MISSMSPTPPPPIAKMGRHVAGITPKERQHHEDKNNYE